MRGLSFFLCIVVSGCGGAALQVPAIDEMDRVRATPAALQAAKLAPEAYARAEQERQIAQQLHAAGDDVGARLHAERAMAAYRRTLAVARLARATEELADAQKAEAEAEGQAQTIQATRAELERAAADLEARVKVERDRKAPAASQPADPAREAARAVAAASLAEQARLLCSAARLVAADAEGLADAEAALSRVDGKIAKRGRAIDDAAQARVHCLDALTRARRAAGNDSAASDALLAELSAAGAWDPSRDERGVLVVLRGSFRGTQLTDDGAKKLADLGRVAAAHAGFALQVVVHDAQAASKSADDDKRADAAVRALVAAGANAARIRSEVAGTRAPVVDPSDAKVRARNERLEIVFVAAAP